MPTRREKGRVSYREQGGGGPGTCGSNSTVTQKGCPIRRRVCGKGRGHLDSLVKRKRKGGKGERLRNRSALITGRTATSPGQARVGMKGELSTTTTERERSVRRARKKEGLPAFPQREDLSPKGEGHRRRGSRGKRSTMPGGPPQRRQDESHPPSASPSDRRKIKRPSRGGRMKNHIQSQEGEKGNSTSATRSIF